MCVLPGVGLSGASHRDDVRLQEAGEDSCEEEERRSYGAQREADPGRAGQPVCGEVPTETLFLLDPVASVCFLLLRDTSD